MSNHEHLNNIESLVKKHNLLNSQDGIVIKEILYILKTQQNQIDKLNNFISDLSYEQLHKNL